MLQQEVLLIIYTLVMFSTCTILITENIFQIMAIIVSYHLKSQDGIFYSWEKYVLRNVESEHRNTAFETNKVLGFSRPYASYSPQTKKSHGLRFGGQKEHTRLKFCLITHSCMNNIVHTYEQLAMSIQHLCYMMKTGPGLKVWKFEDMSSILMSVETISSLIPLRNWVFPFSRTNT